MMCFLCGKEIAWLRSMVDRQYCSAEHRKEARLGSANVLREEEDDEQELWSVLKSRKKQGARPVTTSQTASIFAFLSLAVLLVAMLMLPMGKGYGGSGVFPTGSPDPGTRQGLFERAGNTLSELVRSSAPVTLHHDFHAGLSEWTTAALRSGSKVD